MLYFYPRDNTPGCSTEASDFTTQFESFKQLDCVIIGVSRDSIKSHEKFIEKFDIPFPLIADEDEKVCQIFDVIKMKNMYGKQVQGIERSTFLIDKTGKLAKEWRKVRVPDHVEEILEAVKSLNA